MFSLQHSLDLVLYRVQTYNFMRDHRVRLDARGLGSNAPHDGPIHEGNVVSGERTPIDSIAHLPWTCGSCQQTFPSWYGKEQHRQSDGSRCGDPTASRSGVGVCGQCFAPLSECRCGFLTDEDEQFGSELIDLPISTRSYYLED